MSKAKKKKKKKYKVFHVNFDSEWGGLENIWSNIWSSNR